MFAKQWFTPTFFPPGWFPETGAEVLPPPPAGPGKPGFGGHNNYGFDFESSIAGHMPGLPQWLTPPAPPVAKPRRGVRAPAALPSPAGSYLDVPAAAPPAIGGAPAARAGPQGTIVVLAGAPIDQDGLPFVGRVGGWSAGSAPASSFDNLYVEANLNRNTYGYNGFSVLMTDRPVTPGPPPGGDNVLIGNFVIDQAGNFVVDQAGNFWVWG